MKLFLAVLVMAFTASSVRAADGDLRLGIFAGWFCGARATFDVQEKYADAWVFHGYVQIRDTGEKDSIRIDQYDDNSIRNTRELSGANFGSKQTIQTAPPVFEDGNVAFYSEGGRGPGCNNPGASSVLRMPLELTYEFSEFEVVGQSPEQCQSSMALCSASVQATFGTNAQTVIDEQCTPRYQACMGNAQVVINQFEAEFGVEGKTPDECMASSHDCEARVLAEGYDANAVLSICAPRLEVCLANAEAGDGGNGGGEGTRVRITTGVTGYDAAGGGPDKCYLQQGDTADLIGSDPGDPTWKHLQANGLCNGDDFWIYDDGKLENL